MFLQLFRYIFTCIYICIYNLRNDYHIFFHFVVLVRLWLLRLCQDNEMALKRARSELFSQREVIDSSTAEQQQVHRDRMQAGQELQKLMLSMYASGDLSAEKLCNISYLVTKAGGAGLEDFAFNAKQAHVHGERNLSLALAKVFGVPQLFNQPVPMYLRKGTIREVVDVSIRLPSTIVHHEYQQIVDPEALKLQTESYLLHPVVRTNATALPVLPVALYWDGVEYTANDSFLGFYLRDLISRKVFLLACVRNLHLIDVDFVYSLLAVV